MKKTENIILRVTPEIKLKIFQEAQAENLSASQYILNRVNNTLPTHSQSVESCIIVNSVMNILRNQQGIKKETLENIEKELKNYVRS